MSAATFEFEVAVDNKLETAQALVMQEYARQGYVQKDEQAAEGSFSKFLRLPQSKTFIASLHGQLIGSISIIDDSSLGLPMDAIYKTEVDSLRTKSRMVAEVGQLAIDAETLRQQLGGNPIHRLSLLTSLFSLVYHHSVAQGVASLCITVNPKHEHMYQALGFEHLGGLKEYASVNNAPALAKVLHLDAVQAHKIRHSVLQQIVSNQPTLRN